MLILYAYQSKADRFAWTPAGRVFQLADVYVSHPQISVASPVMSVAAFCVLLLAFSLGVTFAGARAQGCRRATCGPHPGCSQRTTELFNMQSVLIVALLALTCSQLCQGIEQDKLRDACLNQSRMRVYPNRVYPSRVSRLSVQVRQPRLCRLHHARS